LALLMSLSLWAASAQVMGVINFSKNYISAYWVLLCWLPGVVLSQFFQNWFKYAFQRSRFMMIIALQSAIYLIFIISLKLLHKIDLQNVMLASLLSIWIPAVIGLLYLHRMVIFRIDKEILTKLLCYGAPFMLMAFGYNLMFSFDKYLLSGSVSREQFAIYSQAFRIAAIFSMVVSSFNFAFGPLSLSLLNKKDAPYAFAYLRTYYLFFICLGGIAFMAIGRVIILLLSGQDYVSGDKFFPFFIMGYIFYGLYSFAQLGIISSKRSYLGLCAILVGLIITIGLDILLVRQVKGYGVAIGFSLGNLAMVLLANYLSKRYLMISYDNLKDAVIIIMFVICGTISSYLFTISNLYIDGLVKLVVSAIIFCFIIMLPIFKSERNLFWKTLSGKLA